MGRKKGGRQAADDRQQGTMAEAAPAGAEGLTKMEAVRRALAEMGRDAKPLQLQGFVKDRFDIDMTADHVSTYKGIILRKEAGGKAAKARDGRGKGRAAARAVAPVVAAAFTGTGRPARGGISLADIAAVKALVQRLGADHLRALIDVLAR